MPIHSVHDVSKSDPYRRIQRQKHHVAIGQIRFTAGFWTEVCNLTLDVFVPRGSSCWRAQYGNRLHQNLQMRESQKKSPSKAEETGFYNLTSEVKSHLLSNVLFV